jgi:hypothetical protein
LAQSCPDKEQAYRTGQRNDKERVEEGGYEELVWRQMKSLTAKEAI